MITGNDAENRRWDEFYGRISTRPAADEPLPPETTSMTEATEWVYAAAGRAMQLHPGDAPLPPGSAMLQAMYAQPLDPRLSRARPC